MIQNIPQERNRFFLVPHFLENLFKNFAIVFLRKLFAERNELMIVQVLNFTEILQHFKHMDHTLHFRCIHQIAELQKNITDILGALLDLGRENLNSFSNLRGEFQTVIQGISDNSTFVRFCEGRNDLLLGRRNNTIFTCFRPIIRSLCYSAKCTCFAHTTKRLIIRLLADRFAKLLGI